MVVLEHLEEKRERVVSLASLDKKRRRKRKKKFFFTTRDKLFSG